MRRDNVLDIPPIYNSFHRLLLYRIAQRFNLDHCQSDVIYPVRIINIYMHSQLFKSFSYLNFSIYYSMESAAYV
jgi:hypothetical protein